MKPDRDTKAHAPLDEAKTRKKVLRSFPEERFLLRAESVPHLRELLSARIDSVAAELALMTPHRIIMSEARRSQ